LTNEKKLAVGSILIAISALRFLYKVTLNKDWVFDEITPAPKKPQKLPVVLSREEVLHFLTGNPRLLRFCERCGKLFKWNRSNQQYRSKLCNKFAPCNRSHGSAKRKKNWESLQRASLNLNSRPKGRYLKNALNGILSERWVDWCRGSAPGGGRQDAWVR
jgi:hypothetical protein